MYGEDIISAVIHVDETTPHLCDFVPLTKRESIGERRDRRPPQEANDNAERVLALNLHVWSRANWRSLKLYEKDDRVHQGT